ncbi:hypothetical protein J2125_000175 [Erwinia toletana]|uniref:DUF8093 domain-containing protein n=1 Tax=Winslowiella toletana TaxID=92490 RepID=A0ABS4P2V6_9GAMM|nr:hypothetical protein [Winslowiella toletana]MBP2166983.1 hypothetical protein [Winslowiella toletana]
MLDRKNLPGQLFYIDDKGELICRDIFAFRFSGWETILREYRKSVACRDYRQRGAKPRATEVILFGFSQVKASDTFAQEVKKPQTYDMINSKMAGRLLAAGGIYNQNPEMFADTARKLGGEAAQGFDQVLNEQTSGTIFTASAIIFGTKGAAGFGKYRPARSLPRDKFGNPQPDTDIPHTQLGTKSGRRGDYTQAREWGYDSQNSLVPRRDIDFTDHGRPGNHPNPHQHDYIANPIGGALQHGPAKKLEMPK